MKRYMQHPSVYNKRKVYIVIYLLFLILLPHFVEGVEYSIQTVPNPKIQNRYSYVSNPDGILVSGDVAQMNQTLRSLEDSLSIEVAVVALSNIGNEDPRMFATELFRQWGIGRRADDNGLLILLITGQPQRSIVFETGYGLEGALPDAICYRLQQQYMIPDLREGNFSTAMVKGVEAVSSYLKASDYERVDMTGISNNTADEGFPAGIFVLIFLFPIAIMFLSLFANSFKHRKRKCPNCGKKTFKYVRTETVKAATYSTQGVAEDIYYCSNCGYTERKPKNIDRLRSGGGPIIYGGPGGSGRSFGGGGSFGGGSFGGGRSGGGGSISRF